LLESIHKNLRLGINNNYVALMKRILILLTIFPFILIAQSKKVSSKKPPLIESITSDTTNGQFYQVLFIYDQSNRVIGITHNVLKITTVAKKQTFTIIQEEKQIFEYTGSSKAPYVRKQEYSEYDSSSKTWHTDFSEGQYFLYKNGKRIGDSTLLLEENKNIIGKLQQTKKRIIHEKDMRPLKKKNENPNTYENSFNLKSQSNIGEECSINITGSRWNQETDYSFSTFDSKRNPLKQLNIASVLVNEKICFPFGGGQNTNDEETFTFFWCGKYGKKGLGWYFFNQNNPISYTVDLGEPSSDKGIVNFHYRYNQFNQPVFAKANVKIVLRENEKNLLEKYQKRFTFRYKK